MRDYCFGDFLYGLRKRCGLSQYQLGMLVGVSDKAVSKWENGLAKPQSRILYKLSEVLGVTVDELLASQYRSLGNGNEKGVFAMKHPIWEKAYQMLCSRYGEGMPAEILNRYLSEWAEFRETDSIVYFDLLSQMRTMASHNGEHIRIKGAAGASFIAFIMGATEINPLKPHYYCPHCRKIELVETALCGWDLPLKHCSCGKAYVRDGHNLPFETVRASIRRNVHVDLSVSRHLYPAVKKMIRTYFEGNTVVSLFRKDQRELETIVIVNEAVPNLTDGQELPFEEYYDRLRPYATMTLMVDEELHAFKYLEEKTGISFDNVPFICADVLEAFKRNDTEGIPEFRSGFFKDMINEASPTSFHDLIQIAGLAHGTGVWFDNGRQLVKNGMSVGKVISYRDDVFHYIQERMEDKKISNTGYAYKIMEDTRRGIYANSGIPDAIKQQFSALEIEEWFTESIEKIHYLFPKAHGVLYVQYAMLLMWYKIHYPETFQEIFVDNKR